MPGRVVLVVVGMCVVAASLGLYLGLRGDVTETDVIEAGAALYVEKTGGSARECVGVPAEGRGWIEVRCGVADDVVVYAFDRRGRLLSGTRAPGAAGT